MTTKRTTSKAPAEAGAGLPQHPGRVRENKINPNGTVSPFSVDEQWKQLEDWHVFLESDKASNYPALDDLNCSWGMLDSEYVERGADLRRVGDNPLSTLFYFLGMGIYPPPELLLTLSDCWKTYMASGGQMSLDEAFHGKPRKGAGNYASRNKSSFKRMKMGWDFAAFMGQGLTRSQAADALSQIHGGKPDADSILRMFRGVKPEKPPKNRQAEK